MQINKTYRKSFGSLLSRSCDVFRALINSLCLLMEVQFADRRLGDRGVKRLASQGGQTQRNSTLHDLLSSLLANLQAALISMLIII